MRVAASSLLFFLGVAWCASAQQPPAGGPGKLVIRPGGKGVETVAPGGTGGTGAATDPDEKAGFLVIRPGGNGVIRPGSNATTGPARVGPTTIPAPATPRTIAILNVPQPTPTPKELQDGKQVFDYWFAISVEGQRVGHVHWEAKQVERGEKTYTVGRRFLNLTVSRFGQAVTQWGEESTVETPAGEVLVTSMRQGLGKNQALSLLGQVKGDTLEVKGEGAAAGASNSIPWPRGVVGLVREPKLFKERNLKQGESFEYPSYIPTVNRVVKTAITFEGEESKVLWQNTPERKLLRFLTKPEKLEKVKLPSSTTWVDAESFEPLLVETDFPALGGRLVFLRTTKEAATASVTTPVEVFNVQSIRLDREIPGIHGKGFVVYKVSVPRDDEPGTVFAADARQEIKNLDAKERTFELRVFAARGPRKDAPAQPAPGKEYTASNYFINWDNDLVKAHAARAVANLPETATAWEKALAVEKWVKANMKAFEFSQAMATADNVAKTLSGDCTEYAMLSAAMCRALGVPSRTALGLVYAPGQGGKPFLAYHMWAEVYAGDQWVPIDATLSLGGVGPGHVKITDHSWHEEKSFAPLLPVLRALTAKPSVAVLKVDP
jgi:hypothetical protein